jgi:hypothetical protein
LSCTKKTATCVGITMSLGSGTLMKRRSGYVRGSLALNARSVENENLPFMSV